MKVYLKIITDYKSQSSSFDTTDLHPVTQIEIRRNTSCPPPPPPPPFTSLKKNTIWPCPLQHRKLPGEEKLFLHVLTRSVETSVRPVPSRRSCSTGSVPPLAGSSLTAEGGVRRGVGLLGYAPTCGCLTDQCRWWQLGQSAEISARYAPCTKGWSRWGVTRAAAAAAASSSSLSLHVCLYVCLTRVCMFIPLIWSDLICRSVTWASRMLWMFGFGHQKIKNEHIRTWDLNLHQMQCIKISIIGDDSVLLHVT